MASAPPAVSVVVASFSGPDALGHCLDSLADQVSDAQVIVATNLPRAPLRDIRAAHPDTIFVAGPTGANVFQLRSRGIDRATAPFVLLTEDHTTVSSRWVSTLKQALAQGAVAAGGGVDNGRTRRAYDWALYFCEYGPIMPPIPAGPAPALSGINVGYRREALLDCRQVWQNAFRENEVHDVLRAAQYSLQYVAGAEVQSHLEFGIREAMRHLLGGGRHFGAYRVSGLPFPRRLLWILATPAVPAVLFYRLVRRTAERRPERLRPLFRGLFYIWLLLGAWSWGEALGTLLGSADTASNSRAEGA